MNYKQRIILIILLINFTLIKAQNNIKNEFRAVWIATVANIDWPIKSTDSLEKQKKDFIKILETYKELNFNTVIVQIRSVADALYPSKYAPFSKYLTNVQGKNPENNFDVLKWMIEKSHSYGFEFHAWLNPYRATMDLNTTNLSKEHDFYKNKDWMIKYGSKYYYNPGLPEVQEHLINVVDEVVNNYDIDAIHFDDYFYPYKIEKEEFDDIKSFKKHEKDSISINDWRRKNVNKLIEKLSIKIKQNKPWVQFGISPFGVWRNKDKDPNGSETQAGQTNYDDLYADVILWMKNKQIDYLIPQLYWHNDHPKASYRTLTHWWNDNSFGTNIYIGNGSYKIKNDKMYKQWNNPYEIPNQVDFNRKYPNIKGNAYFSAKSFVNSNHEVTKILKENQYKYKALNPIIPSFKKENLLEPKISYDSQDISYYYYKINELSAYKTRFITVYLSDSDININEVSQISNRFSYQDIINNANIIKIPKVLMNNKKNIGFTYIDLYSNESPTKIIEIK